MGFLEVAAKQTSEVQTVRWPELPELTAETARIEGQLLCGKSSIHCKIAGQDVTITAPARSVDVPSIAVDVCFGEVALRVLVPKDALGQLLALHGIEDNWQSYSPETAALVIEHLVADAVAPLESKSGGAFRVLKVEQKEAAKTGPNLPMEVALGEETRQITVLADPDLLCEWIVAMSDGLTQLDSLRLSDLRFAAKLYGPGFAVKAADLATARVGEGFFLEQQWEALSRVDLVISDHLAATALLDSGGFRLTDVLSQIETLKKCKATPMSATAKTTETDIATLPVTVRIELAETNVTLADLQALTVGSLLPFVDQLPTNVRLLANDRPIARGDLVQIDGKIAIRLTEVF